MMDNGSQLSKKCLCSNIFDSNSEMYPVYLQVKVTALEIRSRPLACFLMSLSILRCPKHQASLRETSLLKEKQHFVFLSCDQPHTNNRQVGDTSVSKELKEDRVICLASFRASILIAANSNSSCE